MNSKRSPHDEEHLDLMFLYALQALPPGETAGAEAQITLCAECRQELETLRPIIGSFVSWPTDVLRPAAPLWDRLAQRIAKETGQQPFVPPSQVSRKPEWEQVAPSIAVKMLATNTKENRVTMLVRLAPGGEYPPHRHAGTEELYLLQGELMVDDKKLYPGDYLHAEAGSVDHRVWTETGCTCVLLTSTQDEILR
jgi:anti-sigma factor ChrR (cupin superfamily)